MSAATHLWRWRHLPFLTLAVVPCACIWALVRVTFLTFYKRRLTLTFWCLGLFGECQIYKLKIDCHLLVFIGVDSRLNDVCGLFGKPFFYYISNAAFWERNCKNLPFVPWSYSLASWPCLAVKNERKHFCMQNIVLVLLCKVVLANSKPIIFRRFVLGAWNKLDNAKCVVALM